MKLIKLYEDHYIPVANDLAEFIESELDQIMTLAVLMDFKILVETSNKTIRRFGKESITETRKVLHLSNGNNYLIKFCFSNIKTLYDLSFKFDQINKESITFICDGSKEKMEEFFQKFKEVL